MMKLKEQAGKNKPYILYSHGNSSDIADAYYFFINLAKTIPYNYILYDYTGYGISKKSETTQKSLQSDIQLIIKSLKIPTQRIILWGFSLGTFPTVSIAAKQSYNFSGVILQSPLASAAYFFDTQNSSTNLEQINDDAGDYEIDCLDNISKIGNINSDILILHSSADKIIPISHAYKLYNKIKQSKRTQKYSLLQVQKLSHNQMHYVLAQQKQNTLNIHFRQFMNKIQRKIAQNLHNNINRMFSYDYDKPIHQLRNQGYGRSKKKEQNTNKDKSGDKNIVLGRMSKEKIIKTKIDSKYVRVEHQYEHQDSPHEKIGRSDQLRIGVKSHTIYFNSHTHMKGFEHQRPHSHREKLKISAKLQKIQQHQ